MAISGLRKQEQKRKHEIATSAKMPPRDDKNGSFLRKNSQLCHCEPRNEAWQSQGKIMQYYVYFITNQNNRVLYVGVTNNLLRRLQEHKDGVVDGFTKKYKIYKLVYFETTTDIKAVLEREKQIKSWSRKRKNILIESENPLWQDLTLQWD